jgi:hypothetical protein
MARATKGSGTVRRKTVRRKGKAYTYYEARLTEGINHVSGKQIQKSFTGKTEEDAIRKMKAYESAHRREDREVSVFAPEYIEEFFPRCNQPGAFVYFVSDGVAVKVGASTDPVARMAHLQTGNPRPLELLFTVPFVDLETAVAAEHRYHAAFRDFWLLGEWFFIRQKLNVEDWRNYWARDDVRKDD